MRSLRGARVEIKMHTLACHSRLRMRSLRGARVEIRRIPGPRDDDTGCAPCGERGLKLLVCGCPYVLVMMRSLRGARVEICLTMASNLASRAMRSLRGARVEIYTIVIRGGERSPDALPAGSEG